MNICHNPYLFNEQASHRPTRETLRALPRWNRRIALRLAAEEGVTLGPAHWTVLHYLRRRLVTRGQARHARLLLQELEVSLGTKRNSRTLYKLFPGGPVSQGCRIAGLPAPPDNVDRSFGTIH